MINRKVFYEYLRADKSLFGSHLTQNEVDGIEGLFDTWAELGTGIDRQLGYVFATVYHETGSRMVPVREGFAKSDEEARRIVAHRKYGTAVAPYWHVYYGRGQVQLTWDYNYEDSSDDAGVDLLRYPDKMLDPTISARITILGMLDGRFNGKGKGLDHYLTETKVDYKNARRTVNVLDKWELIKGYSKEFEAAIAAARAAGDVGDGDPPIDPIKPTEPPTDDPTVRVFTGMVVNGDDEFEVSVKIPVAALEVPVEPTEPGTDLVIIPEGADDMRTELIAKVIEALLRTFLPAGKKENTWLRTILMALFGIGGMEQAGVDLSPILSTVTNGAISSLFGNMSFGGFVGTILTALVGNQTVENYKRVNKELTDGKKANEANDDSR